MKALTKAAALVAALLLDLSRASHRSDSGFARLGGRHTGVAIPLDLSIEVILQFLFQFAIEPAALQQCPQA